jgi:4-amino-4-deoxy-L-arabinose transferase
MYQMHPNEMRGILTGALSAYSESVPGHDKPWYYYLNKMMVLFGELVYIPLIYAGYRAWNSKTNRRMDLLALLSWIFIPLVLFSLGETKRFTYLMIAAPAFFILIAYSVSQLQQTYFAGNKTLKWLGKYVLIIGLIGLPIRYLAERIKLFQSIPSTSAEFYQIPNEKLNQLTNRTIVFGTDDYVEMMFHTNVYAAYRKVPDEAFIQSLKEDGFEVLIYDDFEFREVE